MQFQLVQAIRQKSPNILVHRKSLCKFHKFHLFLSALLCDINVRPYVTNQNQDSCSSNLFSSIIGYEKPSGRDSFCYVVMEFAGYLNGL